MDLTIPLTRPTVKTVDQEGCEHELSGSASGSLVLTVRLVLRPLALAVPGFPPWILRPFLRHFGAHLRHHLPPQSLCLRRGCGSAVSRSGFIPRS